MENHQNKEGDLLTVLAINHQAGQITDKEGDLITVLALHHQAGQDINREVDLLTVLAINHQAGQTTDREGDLLTVLPLHHQAGEVTDLEVALLVDIRVLEAEDTRNLLEVECGENHLDHNNNLHTVCDVEIPMRVETALIMRTIGDPRVEIVIYNTRLRATRNGGVIPTTGPNNRRVA